MKILLTGATGYIGKRLTPLLIEQGHEIIACVRDRQRYHLKEEYQAKVTVLEIDFLDDVDNLIAPTDFDIAFYLIHSMSASVGNFEEKEAKTARHFVQLIEQSSAKQIIYLTGIIGQQEALSPHLSSRKQVEEILDAAAIPLTTIRAGIIVGSGSASFEIIRDLVEKLPIMVAPKWLKTRCQPIGIRNILQVLVGVLGKPAYYHQQYDVSGGEILTYQEMLEIYAEVRGLKRWIYTLPIMTPRLSSYWLYFITSTSYPLAVNLVESMKLDIIGQPNNLFEDLGLEAYDYRTCIRQALSIIERDATPSSWKDSYVSSLGDKELSQYIEVPRFGCFRDEKTRVIREEDLEEVKANIWAIGGERGWYYGNWMWKIRGFLDKLVGGIGLRRGRTRIEDIEEGDALDFWRVLVADREQCRLLLFAEMKLPGEAWLEFKIEKEKGQYQLHQTATFRPHGLWGRLYWYSVLPFHYFVFNGMINNVVRYRLA